MLIRFSLLAVVSFPKIGTDDVPALALWTVHGQAEILVLALVSAIAAQIKGGWNRLAHASGQSFWNRNDNIRPPRNRFASVALESTDATGGVLKVWRGEEGHHLHRLTHTNPSDGVADRIGLRGGAPVGAPRSTSPDLLKAHRLNVAVLVSGLRVRSKLCMKDRGEEIALERGEHNPNQTRTFFVPTPPPIVGRRDEKCPHIRW